MPSAAALRSYQRRTIDARPSIAVSSDSTSAAADLVGEQRRAHRVVVPAQPVLDQAVADTASRQAAAVGDRAARACLAVATARRRTSRSRCHSERAQVGERVRLDTVARVERHGDGGHRVVVEAPPGSAGGVAAGGEGLLGERIEA